MRQQQQQPVSTSEGQQVAQRIGAADYLECSAKTGRGVREVFEAARASLRVKEKKEKKKKCVVL